MKWKPVISWTQWGSALSYAHHAILILCSALLLGACARPQTEIVKEIYDVNLENSLDIHIFYWHRGYFTLDMANPQHTFTSIWLTHIFSTEDQYTKRALRIYYGNDKQIHKRYKLLPAVGVEEVIILTVLDNQGEILLMEEVK